MTNTTISVRDFERQVLELEGIHLVIYASDATQVVSFHYKRRTPRTVKIHDWLQKKIIPKLGQLTFAIVSYASVLPGYTKKVATLKIKIDSINTLENEAINFYCEGAYKDFGKKKAHSTNYKKLGFSCYGDYVRSIL